MANEYFYTVGAEFIDFNGHLTEWGFYSYAIRAMWEISEDFDLVPLYDQFKVGPIIFDTKIHFRKEVFENDIIRIRPHIEDATSDLKKFSRLIHVYNSEDIVCASLFSNGAFFDRENRKVITPPKGISQAFSKLIKSQRII